jgi:hypothetical protein
MIEIYGNNAATTLSASISASAVSLTVLSGTGAAFPNPSAGQFFRMTLNDALTGLVYEIVYCTARSGDTFTIVRGQENTAAVAWVSGDKLFEGVTAGAMGNLSQQQQVQQNMFNYAPDTGAANAYAIATTPTMATPVPGALIYWLAANANTGASTITVNGSAAYPLLGPGRSALQGGEVNTFCVMTFDAALASYVLLESSGGQLQLPTAYATKSKQAISLGQAQAQFANISGNASQPVSASYLNTTNIQGGTGEITLTANGGVGVYNDTGTAFTNLNCAPGTISPTSTQAVTGAQISALFIVGEIKIWHGAVANIAAVWGAGWQLANGTNGTANLVNNFIIGAGGSYAVNATGGATAVALGTTQLPYHTHSIGISDPTHAHSVYDPGHNHSIAQSGHGHGVADPGHVHGPAQGSDFVNFYGAGGGNGLGGGGQSYYFPGTTAASATGIGIEASNANVSNYASGTGIGIYAAYTGISASASYAGSGAAFSIMPPYYALCFIEYIG